MKINLSHSPHVFVSHPVSRLVPTDRRYGQALRPDKTESAGGGAWTLMLSRETLKSIFSADGWRYGELCNWEVRLQ